MSNVVFLLLFLFVFVQSTAAQDFDSLFSQANSYRYHSGDSLIWSDPEFDDSEWGEYNIQSFPKEQWRGIGWFRQRIKVDSSLWNSAFGISVIQAGAIEVFMDGEQIYRRGEVSANPDEERPYFIESITVPKKFYFTHKEVPDSGRPEYILAVRYSAHILSRDLFGYTEPRLAIQIDEFSQLETNFLRAEKKATNHQMFLTGFFLALALLHSLLFGFYPRFKANGWFAVLAICAAVLNFLRFDQQFSNHVDKFIVNITAFNIIAVILMWSMIHLVFLLVHEKRPSRSLYYTLLCFVMIAANAIWPMYLGQAMFLIITLIMVDILYLVLKAFIMKQFNRFDGGWIILVSFCPILISVLYLSLVEIGLMKSQFNFIDFPVTYYSLLLLFIGFSIFLSYNFSHLNKNLLRQLDEVKRLSQKTIDQEKEKAYLEAENTRKSKELEEARNLQLSMLPEKMPELRDLEFAVFMKTATEVGGDYYDYTLHGEDDLTIAFGDAAGHGLQAGIMVTAVKSLFKSIQPSDSLSRTLQIISKGIKGMGFGRLFMAMTIIRYTENKLIFSAAGMPHPLHFKKDEGHIEFIEINGIPLGRLTAVDYEELSINLKPGDKILLVSDGYTEMSNERGEMLGERRLYEYFNAITTESPENIIRELLDLAEQWAGSAAPEDDITLMVIYKKR